MKNIMLLCLLAYLFGCQPNPDGNASSKNSLLNENEQQAVLLSGSALSGKATGALSADGSALELTISNSAVLAQAPDLLKLHASRAAWVFYKNMGTGKPGYERLVVKVGLADSTFQFPYSLAQLGIVEARYPAIELASQKLITGDYDGLYALFDPVVMGTRSAADLQNYCLQIEPEHGQPLGFEFQGFSFEKTSGGLDVLSLAGQLKRSIKDTPLNISVDLSKQGVKGSLFSIKFAY